MFIILLNLSALGRVNDPPVVTCLEVHEGGDVTIYWQSLDLSALEFKIFYSIDEVVWDQAGSVDTQNSSLSFHHTTARADTIRYYYYITATYPSGDEVSSDNFSTIFLVVDNSIPGEALLIWNPVHDPLPEGSSTYYRIYNSIYDTIIPAPGSWTLIDSLENTLFNHTIKDGLCLDSINFKIEISNSYGCQSVSNIAGDWFSDLNQPQKPILDSVSINSNNNVVIGWDSIDSPDVAGIIIYRKVGTAWPDSTQVILPYSTFYEDTTQYPCNTKNILYAIASIDSCGNKSPKTELTAQRPIFLYTPEFNMCSKTISIGWEPYINAIPSFNKYEIWSSINNGPFVLIDEVSSTLNSYDHIGVENATEYTYFVRAVFNNSVFTSTSCTKSILTGSFVKPNSLYLVNADVLPDNNIELTLDIDLFPNSCSWEILRSDVGGGTQSIINTFSRSQVTNSPYIYLDDIADGSTGYYTYSLNVYDSCGALSLQSNIIQTIFLQGTQLTENENSLSWNTFDGWDGGVEKYYIFRMLGTIFPTAPIDSTDALTTEFTDDITNVDPGESRISYWVQAVEGSVNQYGFSEKSNSNIINFFRETEMYLPNAFRPVGLNDVFKPVTVGFGGSNYLFQIYNRWGQLIFESTDHQVGWNGTYNGEPAQQGTYVYLLNYLSVFGESKNQKGTVTLID